MELCVNWYVIIQIVCFSFLPEPVLYSETFFGEEACGFKKTANFFPL